MPKHMWAATWQHQQNGCAPSEDSDQLGPPPSLIRAFAVRMKKTWVPSYPLSAQRRLWSDWMPRLIWVFAGRTLILLALSCRGSYLCFRLQLWKIGMIVIFCLNILYVYWALSQISPTLHHIIPYILLILHNKMFRVGANSKRKPETPIYLLALFCLSDKMHINMTFCFTRILVVSLGYSLFHSDTCTRLLYIHCYHWIRSGV